MIGLSGTFKEKSLATSIFAPSVGINILLAKKDSFICALYKCNCIFFLAAGIFITPNAYGNSLTGILEIENNVISVELARTKEEHARGLMYRKSLGKYNGMLFIYGSKKTLCMWMKNTFIPLTVLFIDDRGYVVNMKDMIPNTETPHCSDDKVRFALELETEWLKSTNITLKSRITNLNSFEN
ncbi:DUF192 domain-containing protein [Betaproteobacteria bacterium]|nr:DUF192 domain-containing protein [Betaproteobacteria bacterium]